jgi:hypothetical protein
MNELRTRTLVQKLAAAIHGGESYANQYAKREWERRAVEAVGLLALIEPDDLRAVLDYMNPPNPNGPDTLFPTVPHMRLE